MSYEPDLQSLADGSLSEVNEETNEDRDDLLGAGSNFLWRLRITPPEVRCFSLRKHEVVKTVQSRRLPQTIVGFYQYLAEVVPSSKNKAFCLKCHAWPTSPYSIVAVQFYDDLLFGGDQQNERAAVGQEEEKYRGLMYACRRLARNHPKKTIEFEVNINFVKAGKGGAEHQEE